MSMNTALKNARIFDDDAWDENDKPKTPEIIAGSNQSNPHFPNITTCSKIKIEPKEVTPPPPSPKAPASLHQPCIKKEPLNNIKEEEMDDTFEEGELEDSIIHKKLVKQENDTVKKLKIKQELNSSMEEGELEDSMIKTKTPPSPNTKLKFEGAVDKIFDESPYNKEVFKSLRLDDKTPIKNEAAAGDLRSSLKSAKRTVFSRLSPYKVHTDTTVDKIGVKTRLGTKLGSVQEEAAAEKRKKSSVKAERDPAVISRREKQIEYGKNTMGYENYIKMVPKDERVSGDPQTPPLYNKYSRRGWEGLIKQWRIQLHQFDPPEAKSEDVEEKS